MLVLAELDLRAPHLRQQVVEATLRVGVHPQRQRVDEEPDHLVGVGERGAAAGARGAEDDVRIGAVALQQDRPGRLQQRIECHAA